jgi:ferritin-like metal-binding protein YciE
MEPQSREDLIKKYVSDMHAVAKHVLEAFERQQQDADVQKFSEASQLIAKVVTTMRSQHNRLDEHSRSVGAEPHSMTKEAISAALGMAAGLYDKIRSHAVSKMLRDDYVALTMCCVAYEMLHTTGLAVKDQATADIALSHLKDLTPLVMQIGQAIPAVVTRELAESGVAADTTAAETAAKNNKEAWRTQPQAA